MFLQCAQARIAILVIFVIWHCSLAQVDNLETSVAISANFIDSSNVNRCIEEAEIMGTVEENPALWAKILRISAVHLTFCVAFWFLFSFGIPAVLEPGELVSNELFVCFPLYNWLVFSRFLNLFVVSKCFTGFPVQSF